MAGEDGWLLCNVDRAKSNRDTWVSREDLTDVNEDIQSSNLESKVATEIVVIQMTGAS
jgi:hypothetical protein